MQGLYECMCVYLFEWNRAYRFVSIFREKFSEIQTPSVDAFDGAHRKYEKRIFLRVIDSACTHACVCVPVPVIGMMYGAGKEYDF